MKKLIFLIPLFSLATLLGMALFKNFYKQPSLSFTPQQLIKQGSPSPRLSSTELVAEPAELQIPQIGVDASVEQVGLDAQRKMDVPKDPNDVGWYDLGVKPGEVGNAVIDGHLDTATSAAVFARLTELKQGDKILVKDKNNRTLTFEVQHKETFPFDQVPLEQIFGPNNSKNLNLITCGGFFNGQTRNYSQRVVVYSSLVSS